MADTEVFTLYFQKESNLAFISSQYHSI